MGYRHGQREREPPNYTDMLDGVQPFSLVKVGGTVCQNPAVPDAELIAAASGTDASYHAKPD